MPTIITIIIAVVAFIVAAVITRFLTISSLTKDADSKIGSAETRAREIIDDALKTAETTKKEALLEVKEESIKTKNELEKETKERRSELQRYEKRVLSKEEALDKRSEAIEQREANFTAREEQIKQREAKVEELNQQRVQELERISGLTSEQAKEYLLKTVEEDVKLDTAKLIKEMENKAKEEADKKAKDYVVTAIQKCAADHVAETTISVVQLPNDEMKGRIIGREGRNIRTLETMTGVDLIIDDTPETITVSCFDPIRREIARLALEQLIKDGRIQPGRIEEVVNKIKNEMEANIMKTGEDTVFKLGIGKIDREIIRLIGRLKYRFSYGQNALQHSVEVAHLAGMMAAELGLNQQLAKRAGLLHDIGKALDFEVEGSHIELGYKFCKKHGERDVVLNAIQSHHGEVEPAFLISNLVIAADTISAARPGARYESLQNYINRLEDLEKITKSFDGVESAYAIQAGREVRVMAVPDKMDDLACHKLARDIRDKIEAELTYPGQIKVTVIRETRASELAR